MRGGLKIAVPLFLLAELLGIFALALGSRRTDEERLETRVNRRLASALQLSDVTVLPEPSYCRHLSQTDAFAPFADHPASLEHFPAGAVVPIESTEIRRAAPTRPHDSRKGSGRR